MRKSLFWENYYAVIRNRFFSFFSTLLVLFRERIFKIYFFILEMLLLRNSHLRDIKHNFLPPGMVPNFRKGSGEYLLIFKGNYTLIYSSPTQNSDLIRNGDVVKKCWVNLYLFDRVPGYVATHPCWGEHVSPVPRHMHLTMAKIVWNLFS